MNTVETHNERPANVSEIEAQIRALWQDLGEQHADSAHVVTRVCTLTLISYGANAELAKRVRAAVPAVFGTHPCRALLIEADGAADELSAWVTTVCQRPVDEGEQVCCEQITLTVGENMRRRLPGTVLPLVVSELPLFVWWPGPLHPASNVRTQLFAHADRWIVDSADFAEPLPDLARLHELVRSDETIAVSDLTWARLTPWRTMVAQIFDHPTVRPALDQISALTVTMGRHEAAALLGVGWVASCLGWQATAVEKTADGLQCTFSSANTPVTVTLQTAGAEDEGVPTIALTCATLPHLKISLGRGTHHQAVASVVQIGDEIRTQVGELRVFNDGTLLTEELNVYSHDRMYEAALAVVATIRQQLEA
jgi:glucose-6-phosphate dehydrogenase assembly protein OpcA